MNDFIRAAQSILESEGAEGVSARKVAQLAGWSYATIYNYFTDINHLLWYCIPAYVEDIYERVQAAIGPETNGSMQLHQAYQVYVGYFLERPNIYKFMFLTDIGPPPAELEAKLAESVLGQGQELILRLCADQGLIRRQDIDLVGELLFVAINGALFVQATGKFPVSPRELEEKISGYISYILREEGNKQ